MKIVVADPQERIRRGLRLLLEQQPGWAVIGEAADCQSLLALAIDRCPDLVLIDWDLSGMEPAHLLRMLQTQFPKIARLTLSGNEELKQAALAAGADGFACKTEPPDKLIVTIRELQARKLY